MLVTPGIPIATSDLPPGMKQAMFQAIASTLIYGKQDAVLVDAFMTWHCKLDMSHTKLGFKTIFLVGHDIEGQIAYSYAAAHPTEVKRLVVPG